MRPFIKPEEAQAFWQEVWDGFEIKLTVPPMPALEPERVRALESFGFLIMYLPPLTEDEYPARFVTLDWKEITEWGAERLPLTGAWVAIETVAKPVAKIGGPEHPADDPLKALSDFYPRNEISRDALYASGLRTIARVLGFPTERVRLPSAEEWNFAGNVFSWLRQKRGMGLPDLGTRGVHEWTRNNSRSRSRPADTWCLYVGGVGGSVNALDDVRTVSSALGYTHVVFRLLIELS